MKFCQYHSDPDCEICKGLNPEEQKKAKVAEEVKNGIKDFKKESSYNPYLIRYLGSAGVVLALIVFLCWIWVPGFLKPDEECTLLNIASYYAEEYGVTEVDYVEENEPVYSYVELDRLSVALRNDGKPYTTILFKDRNNPSGKYKSVIILVPNNEGSEKWNKFLNELRGKHEAYNKKKEEEARRLSTPTEVFPSTK